MLATDAGCTSGGNVPAGNNSNGTMNPAPAPAPPAPPSNSTNTTAAPKATSSDSSRAAMSIGAVIVAAAGVVTKA